MLQSITFMLGLLLFVGCQTTPPQTLHELEEPVAVASFVGNKYQHEHANGTLISLEFDAQETRFYGKVVNRYFGNYKLDDKKQSVSFSQVGATMMMGPQTAMQVEHVYFKFLPLVTTYKLKPQGLELITADGDSMLFLPVSVEKE